MTENEKSTFEREIRNKVLEEQRAKRRAYRAEWRARNREHIRNYDRAYRLRGPVSNPAHLPLGRISNLRSLLPGRISSLPLPQDITP